jgi:hypothetical protein
MNPILPVKTLHGTSWQSLCEDYENARIAVDDATNALSKIEFNSRDYAYGTWRDAIKERHDIYEKLSEVRDFLMTHALHLS